MTVIAHSRPNKVGSRSNLQIARHFTSAGVMLGALTHPNLRGGPFDGLVDDPKRAIPNGRPPQRRGLTRSRE